MAIELTENPRAGSFILSLDDTGNYSHDNIVVQAGQGVLYGGTVLGSVASAGSAASAAEAFGNTGNGTLTLDATAPLQPGVANGVYHVRFTSATAFNVENGELQVIGSGVVGTTYNAALKFLIAAGSTPFVVGDGFDIGVTNYGTEYVQYDETASTGAQIAAAILLGRVDATSANVKATGVARHTEVNHDLLIFKANATPAGKAAAFSEGKLTGEALVGEGRTAKINVAVAIEQLKTRLDASQRFGLNGLSTRLTAASASATEELPFETPPDGVQPPPFDMDDSVVKRIQAEKLRQAELLTMKMEAEDRRGRGIYLVITHPIFSCGFLWRQARVPRIVWNGFVPLSLAVSTAVRTSASACAAHMAR